MPVEQKKLAPLIAALKRCSGFVSIHSTKKGGLLIEAMIAILVFGLFATAAYITLLTGQESTRTGSQRVRGVLYAEQAIEVAKAIRTIDFDDLSEGTHGYSIDDITGEWILTGSSLSRYGYTTKLIVANSGTGRKRITATTEWKIGYFRSGSTVLSTELTEWGDSGGVGDWSTTTQNASWTPGYDIDINDMITHKDYLYFAADGTSTGDTLYIFDVETLGSPSRVSTTFAQNDIGYALEVYEDRLYVADNTTSELSVYDIEDPTSLASGTSPIATYDIPGGAGRVSSLKRDGHYLYVGANANASEDELYILDMTTGSTLTLVDSYDVGNVGSINDIDIKKEKAYLATDDLNEIIILDVSDPTSIEAVGASSLESVAGASAIQYNSPYLYASYGSSIYDEFYKVTLYEKLASMTGAVTVEEGAAISDMEATYNNCFAFNATSHTSKEVDIYAISGTGASSTETINLPTSARTLHYDVVNDVLFVGTKDHYYIYSPNSSPRCT